MIINCSYGFEPSLFDAHCSLECNHSDCPYKQKMIGTSSESGKLFRREMVNLNDPEEGGLALRIMGICWTKGGE